MTNPYPKPRWDLENDVLRLEQMIILYEQEIAELKTEKEEFCLLYTSPSPRDRTRSRMPSSA